ncbi:RNA-binding S4 domain-containing protein [Jannaschia ovalis]|uniref:RNA-binding S4 domain-containing protein n=1 Tax=Jannaschia ovalis TaxID=3038773 RepID=A0ABY8LFE0_9RHOB|nr:RNA-binding S4 domain-containing protein [Jannaschia sp. GRR-S6-38]WGH79050.1 RNA-binding S4 domain-containing protein [Jannaschia sp. GRR-S6-38]
MSDAPGRLRLDKWLWQARFFKTRSLAARMIGEGRVRLNGARVTKPAQAVVPGDALTFPQGDRIRVVEIAALGERRGPAAEAQTLYADHTPPPQPRLGPRPTGRDRRRMDALRDDPET